MAEAPCVVLRFQTERSRAIVGGHGKLPGDGHGAARWPQHPVVALEDGLHLDARDGGNPHILSLSPPINMDPKWRGAHPGYTLAKYGMSLLTLGWAAEYAEAGGASNCLWPQTLIATAAVQNLLGGDAAMEESRTPENVADAAIEGLTKPAPRVHRQHPHRRRRAPRGRHHRPERLRRHRRARVRHLRRPA